MSIWTHSIPTLCNNCNPSSERYCSTYTTRFMPAWIISFAHSMQGDAVMYSVAPSQLFALLATFVMALASACNT